MNCYLEHANITVESIEESMHFLSTAFPHFEVRGKGESNSDGIVRKWLHFGTEETYVALEQISLENEGTRRPYKDPGVNHIGFVIDDFDNVVKNLKEAGYKESISVEPHPFRKRAYFFDSDGNEFEFIEYLSDNPAERNDYSL